jgi:quercetin dioxygenase-like cupin family protein
VYRVGRLSQTQPDLGMFAGKSEGLTRRPLVDRSMGSPHQALAVCELAPGGRVDLHLQAYEEAFYVLDGTLTLEVAGRAETLAADDYCWLEMGVPHALRNAGATVARWLEVDAPAPGATMVEDTLFPSDAGGIALPDVPFRRGRFDEGQLPPPSEPFALAGTGANVGRASVRVLVGPELGASQLVLMLLQYAPGGFIAEHDHVFEEAFFFLSGEIEAVLEGDTHTLSAGDYFWSGVGSSHALVNRGDVPVRWLETQAPQPPPRHQFRFKADWERVLSALSA